MIETKVLEKAIEEIENKNFDMTKQFLEIHKIAYDDNKPKIARIDQDNQDETAVYFEVEGERFYYVVYVSLKPTVSVRWTNTAPNHSVYFYASSDQFSLKELSEFTKLTPTQGWNKGDRPRPNAGVLTHSTIILEPNPEAAEFEEKLNKLLDYLEQDKDGVAKLASNNTDFGIHAGSFFHNGNTSIGSYSINKEQIKRMSDLNLDFHADIYAEGNFFK